MSKSKMRLVNILTYLESIDEVLQKIVSFPCIEIVLADKIVETVHGSKIHTTNDLATPLLNEINVLEKECHLSFRSIKLEGISDSLDDIAKEIKDVHNKIDGFNNQLASLHELYDKYMNASQQVSYIASLDVSLDDVFECTYVNARVGKLPIDSIAKLEYYNSTPFIFKSFAEKNDFCWCMYFSTNGYERAVDNIFSSLLFERIYIPDFVHGLPQEAEVSLQKEIEATLLQIKKTEEQRDEYISIHKEIVERMRFELEVLSKVHQAEKFVVQLGSRCLITGFIDMKDEDNIKSLFSKDDNVEIEIRPADSDKRLKAPKKMSEKTCK